MVSVVLVTGRLTTEILPPGLLFIAVLTSGRMVLVVFVFVRVETAVLSAGWLFIVAYFHCRTWIHVRTETQIPVLCRIFPLV